MPKPEKVDKVRELTERFKSVAPNLVEWSSTFEDPHTWTVPWTIAMDLARDRGGLLFYECHENNYGMQNILRGARAADAR